MCVKIVAECKEDVLLETVAIQETQDRVFLFIRYLYPNETQPETRKRPKKWVNLCEVKVGEPSRISSISGSPPATVKTYSFSWPRKLDTFMVLHTMQIWEKLEAI